MKSYRDENKKSNIYKITCEFSNYEQMVKAFFHKRQNSSFIQLIESSLFKKVEGTPSERWPCFYIPEATSERSQGME